MFFKSLLSLLVAGVGIVQSAAPTQEPETQAMPVEDYLDVSVAVKEDGGMVVLFPNGTWKALDSGSSQERQRALRSQLLRQKMALGEGRAYAVWYDGNKWVQNTPPSSKEYQQEFVHASGGAYVYLQYNTFRDGEVSWSDLKSWAVKNANLIVDGVHLKNEENRKINGVDTMILHMEGMYFGVPMTPLVFAGHYTMHGKSAIQFVAYTTPALYRNLENDITELFHGLVIDPFAMAEELSEKRE